MGDYYFLCDPVCGFANTESQLSIELKKAWNKCESVTRSIVYYREVSKHTGHSVVDGHHETASDEHTHVPIFQKSKNTYIHKFSTHIIVPGHPRQQVVSGGFECIRGVWCLWTGDVELSTNKKHLLKNLSSTRHCDVDVASSRGTSRHVVAAYRFRGPTRHVGRSLPTDRDSTHHVVAAYQGTMSSLRLSVGEFYRRRFDPSFFFSLLDLMSRNLGCWGFIR